MVRAYQANAPQQMAPKNLGGISEEIGREEGLPWETYIAQAWAESALATGQWVDILLWNQKTAGSKWEQAAKEEKKEIEPRNER